MVEKEETAEKKVEDIKIEFTKKIKPLVKASWVHNGMLYVICLSKHISQLTDKFSKTYKLPKEKVRIGSLEDLIKEIVEHNTRVLISIRDGKILYDPMSLISSLKINIEKGVMAGTKEAILRKFLLIKDHLKEIESTKYKVFDNIYTSTIEAAQTALILRGKTALIPRLIPDALKECINANSLEKSDVEAATEIIKTFKAFEHKKIPMPEGKKMDDLIKKSEIFRDSVKEMR